MKNLLWWIGSMVVVLVVLGLLIEITDAPASNPSQSSRPSSAPAEAPLPTFKVQ